MPLSVVDHCHCVLFSLMHTHYDNLKVSRDAPPEVIRAAYKSLSQKYHPDRHADSEKANRIMRLLNAAYEVLSDPERRAEHDQWILAQERLEADQKLRHAQAARAAAAAAAHSHTRRQPPPRQPAQTPPPRPAPQPQAREAEPPPAPPRRERKRRRARDERAAQEGPATPLPKYGSYALYAAIGIVIVVLLGDWSGVKDIAPDAGIVKPAQATTGPASTPQALAQTLARTVATGASPGPSTVRDRKYARPSLTPRGLPWPTYSGYLPGYPVLNGAGLSTLTVDNTGSPSDVLLKLVAVDGNTPLPVRTSFVQGGSTFTMENISPGSYDLRYQSLETGEIFRSDRFELAEIREPAGTTANRNVFRIQTVPGGTSRSVAITEREFP